MACKRIAVLSCLLSVLTVAYCQPFSADEVETFEEKLSEPVARNQSDYEGFVYKLDTNAPASEETPNGSIRPNQVTTNPFLSTLPGDGNGQTLVTLGPCASNTPHTHPRGSEISYLLYGELQFGMVEENGGGERLIMRNITQNDTIHIPTGILHFSHNPTCYPAAFLANFATRDPGTQTMWNALLKIPNRILHAASGIPESTFQVLKSKFALVTAPGTGGEDCLARCNLTFATSNKLYNLDDEEVGW